MPELPTNPPTCPCGYNLSGLTGPPWTCPECAQVTQVWPPPEPLIASLTPFEQFLWNSSLLALGVCPLIVPWVADLRDVGLTLGVTFLIGAGLGALVVADLFARPDHDKPAPFGSVVRTFHFLFFFFMGLVIIAMLIAVSSAIRRAVLGHS